MNSDSGNANHVLGVLGRLLPAVGPTLLISVGYVDPGKWAATVDGGARFGFDLVLPMLIFNLAAILCQYLSAKVGIVTARDLVQICSEEYDKGTCMLLGIQTAVSVIAMDLSMVLGIAHGLNLLLGLDLPTCVFLTAVDAVLFPFFGAILEKHKGYYPSICVAGALLLFYFFGVLISQPEAPLSLNANLTLSKASAFALMSLLGASIMPHNFYMHSSIVLHHPRSPNVSKSTLCYESCIAILCIFSGIYMVNYVLMNSAAYVFHSTGFVLVTFPDALLLVEQVFRSPVAPLFFVAILYLSNQISALTWNHGGQVVVHDFLLLDIPNWLQRATTRIVAIVPALFCVLTSGVEGAYQLLIFSQVMVALLLPSSVIPLFRVASSRAIMGAHKMSQVLEFLAVIAFMGMLGLKMIFVVEMIFGDSDWIGNLQWNMGSSSSVPYAVLILTACTSFCLMLWLAATPLKSATHTDAQAWNWDANQTSSEPSVRRDETYLSESRYVHKQEAVPIPTKPFEGFTDRTVVNADPHLPDAILDSHKDLHLRPMVENQSDVKLVSPLRPNQSDMKLPIPVAPSAVSKAANIAVTELDLPDSKMKVELLEPIEKIVSMEGDFLPEKEHDKVDTWGPEEPSKGVPERVSSLTSDGPSSFRSLSGKSEDGGNGSLSRLAGLGRAARRQLATVLDEFWGQLYDFHGQATQDAKNRRLDLLLIDSKLSFSFLKVDPPTRDYRSSSLCDSPRQVTVQSTLDSPYGGLRGSSSLLSNRSHLLDSFSVASSTMVDPSERRYSSLRTLSSADGWGSTQSATVPVMDPSERRYSSVRNLPASDGWGNTQPAANLMDLSERRYSSVRNLASPDSWQNTQAATNEMDPSERRYSSVRTLPSSDGWGNTQPATIHGYQIASIANRIAKERSSSGLNCGMESMLPISSAMGMQSYRDPQASLLGQRLQTGLSSPRATGYQNFAVSRNSSLQSETQYYDVGSMAANNAGQTTTSKQYHSLPDISGIAGPYREQFLSRKPTQRDGSGGFTSSLGRTSYESSLYPNIGLGNASSSSFDNISTSYGDAFSFPTTSTSTTTTGTGSPWSGQPYDQFGMGDKRRAVGCAVGSRSNSIAREASSIVDAEAKLLRSFRCCIVKLLKLEGSDWLFRQNDGADEDLIDRVAARERFLYEAEAREMGQKNDEASIASILASPIPHCGEGCVWKADLIVSFGVWCIHRILDLSLMESRPELWGKYTYVLNRLQGIVEPAFLRPRTPMQPCFCLQLSAAHQHRLLSQPPSNNVMLPPTAKPGKGKCTTAAMVLEMIKDVEIAISCRKGRSGTAAGDVAFPKGKENLASVLKRYKRRLSNKPAGK